jgi:hypothetical protein
MSSIAEKTIKKYLPSLKVEGKPVRLKSLPALYQGLYDFEELDIFEQPFLVVKVKDKGLGPKDFKKHSKILKSSLDYPQIWFLKELHFNKVQRMIQNELNFIIEDKQVHLPSLNVSIRLETVKVSSRTQLSGMSVNMLVREILLGDLTGKSKVEIATIFKTTKMSAGRAIEPLLENELCAEIKVGVVKKIEFKERLELWNYLKNNIKTPVKEIIFLDKVPKALPLSSISALSKQSMLADDELLTFASDKKAFKKKFTNTEPVLEDSAKARIELWDRPTILQEDGCINILDIYLVLKESKDERVQIELSKLLKKQKLEI